ncbi:DNA-binding transcriptional activator of the SARP family [Amycolatopsis arida]|uniref:DNA-binding transcriptional activator of the SARP family n=1 Tax=Amycolatopsis arida TaxID=587909 RepID=A0A1I5VAI8_9PSEU|nr:BTAD domain-containing putative transcriptional regulator [Amycolatopsis arida]TDX91206.1 DNA-binding SARP family transcriptional activator [Amycolatopsis arida]SFQ04401.1 DNA-binding transcriptional activator of the SARP family [Amycolatopsis arida]
MKVSVLGPLEVLRDGVVATPSAPKLRQVLSLLVMRANSVVRNEQIVEELWEDNPPVSVTTTLQTYIYQLRKLLKLRAPEPAGSDQAGRSTALHSFPSGYLLSLSPESLDARIFESLAQRGHAQLESGEVAQAADTLAKALTVWRGPALVDVDPGPLLQAEVLRLEEIRKSTLELRIDADLRLGRHHSLLGELTGLVAQQPTHEGFQAKLMLALYRAGRRSEALHAYQQARTVLADELGLDPSRDIQRLHRAVLASDRSLDLTPVGGSARVRSRPNVPTQLSPEGPALVGRDEEVAAAVSALSPGGQGRPIAVVIGPPGVGKLAFCRHVAHRLADAYPDGLLSARLLDARDEPAELGEVLGALLRRAGVPAGEIPGGTDERLHAYRGWTAQRKALIVLDDVVDDRQLLALLPAGPGCGVLAASRRRLSVPYPTTTVDLSPLTMADGVELLAQAIGAERVGRDVEAARGVVRICDGLPAALHAAASRLQLRPHWSIGRAAQWLNQEIGHCVSTGADPLTLRPSVERTYRMLPEHARAAFRALTATAAHHVTVGAAATSLDVDEYTAEALLEELAEVRLLEIEPVTGEPDRFRYWFLPRVRTVGHQLGVERHPPRQRSPLDEAALIGQPALS